LVEITFFFFHCRPRLPVQSGYVTATTALSMVPYWPKHKTSISDKRYKYTALITQLLHTVVTCCSKSCHKFSRFIWRRCVPPIPAL